MVITTGGERDGVRYLEEGTTKKQDNMTINLPGAGVPHHCCHHIISHGGNDNDEGRGVKV